MYSVYFVCPSYLSGFNIVFPRTGFDHLSYVMKQFILLTQRGFFPFVFLH